MCFIERTLLTNCEWISNQNVLYSVLSSADGSVFVKDNPNFDVMTTPQYKLYVRVSDHLASSALPDKELTIDLTWVNRAPYFSPQEYHVTIPENNCNVSKPLSVQILAFISPSNLPSYIGAGFFYLQPTCNGNPIALLTGRDRDIENNGRPPAPHGPATDSPGTCRVMAGSGSQFFTMNGCNNLGSGTAMYLNIVGNIDLDREPQYEYINLTVEALDSHGKRGVAYVYIRVTRVNKHDPVFQNTPYTASIEGMQFFMLQFLIFV